ncbi:hypothetical protein Efla_001501 [Eimeria flavescens]
MSRRLHPPDLFPACPDGRERKEFQAEERHCEIIRRGDAPGARSPRSPPPRRVSSLGEQGPLGAAEVPRLQGATSPGVSVNEGPPVFCRIISTGVTSRHPYRPSVRVCLLPQGARLPLPRHHYLLGHVVSLLGPP